MAYSMGSMYIIMLVNFVQLILYVIILPLRKYARINKCRKKIKKDIMWNFVIRLIMETALELSFCCFLNFPYFYRIANFEGFFEILDYFMTIVISLMIAIMPFWIAIFYIRNFEDWGTEKFEEKYGAPYEGLFTDKRWSIANSIIFMLRRVILAATCLYLRNFMFL
jgi:hypothetical protein